MLKKNDDKKLIYFIFWNQFDQIIYFQALNFEKFDLEQEKTNWNAYPLGGNFFPPPPKRKEGFPHPRKEGERVGSILFYLFFYCILMILNIAFQFSCKKGNIGVNNLNCLKILCSPYLSRNLREKPVAIFRITIFFGY